MDTILRRIVDTIRTDEHVHFESFDPRAFRLVERTPPVDVLPLIAEEFFVIAEVKKHSPSKGLIRSDFDPIAIARAYERAGASAVSVLTEKNFFGGAKDHLENVKRHISLPVLRKDFIVHPYQVYESYNLGADFILLIAACLGRVELEALHALTRVLGMNAVIEVHDEEELERALRVSPAIIGINNRDLATFEVDTGTSFKLKRLIPDGVFVISESGIRTREEVSRLHEAGFAGVLVGEVLLREDDVARALEGLIDA